MTENTKHQPELEPETLRPAEAMEEMHLDDARRIKVLSPGMLVFRRFIRNRLAVVGFGILFFMFTFSFLGPLFSPYTQTQVFKGQGSMAQDYAGATYNTELRYTVADGQSFGSGPRAQFLLAKGKNATTFTYNNTSYSFINYGQDVYRIMQLNPVVELIGKGFNSLNGNPISTSLISAFQSAQDAGLTTFDLDGVTYYITKSAKATRISTSQDVALAQYLVVDPFNEADSQSVASFDFKLPCSLAIVRGETTFTSGDKTYSIVAEGDQYTVLDASGNNYAQVSTIIVNPIDQAMFLPVEFKTAVRKAIDNRETEFPFTDTSGETVNYTIVRVNTTYNIKTETSTQLIRIYEPPSLQHPIGLDNNGMDVMTRLMFGGRVSLMVGFVVIFFEVVLGVIVGGISGFFGGLVDTSLMRFVDLVNSIPFYPMVLILGSVMDTMEVEPMTRIFLLMAMLGILGWTGVARITRGQILSLREQDFMVATEATGLRTSRRIFKHLIPNVMPLLIVYATAGLCGIIITEATLGFLGLGIKYPLASWGSIINTASDAYVMTNFWFMWIPAGTLILLTVLGFNFVGDGLRDAYDPKMKR
jgi:peptide/nickel transport system permease protein